MYVSYILLQVNSYFSKIALVGFQYEPVGLDVNEVILEENHDIPTTREKKRQRNVKASLNGVDMENETECTQMLSA